MTRFSGMRAQHLLGICFLLGPSLASAITLSQTPLYINQSMPPLNMLVMGQDHELYRSAYSQDVRFDPATQYFGYFNSGKCYRHNGSQFNPAGDATASDADSAYACLDESSGPWSGNFLNYLTTTRFDAVRKVLYGGKRFTDTSSATVLERTQLPENTAWGVEYRSVAVDGYDISNYTPLSIPDGVGTPRHLFANLSDAGVPLLRVLTNSRFRVWDWVSKPTPVASDTCTSVALDCETESGEDVSHPDSPGAFARLLAQFEGQALNEPGQVFTLQSIPSFETLNGVGGAQAFLTLIKGQVTIETDGSYEFAVAGSDSIELLVNGDVVAWAYVDEVDGVESTTTGSKAVFLEAGTYDIELHHEGQGLSSASYEAEWRLNSGTFESIGSTLGPLSGLERTLYGREYPASAMDSYAMRVSVCRTGDTEGCDAYVSTDPDSGATTTSYKPIGLLQKFGVTSEGEDSPAMKFGLLSGSSENSESGGVLRRIIADITDEIDSDTGVFLSAESGLIAAIDAMDLAETCSADECLMRGNPIGEMMYESLRYFAGLQSATGEFTNGVADRDDLPVLEDWADPYATNYSCAAPVQTIISGISPSYDSDEVPGSAFADASAGAGSLADLNVAAQGSLIWNTEFGSVTGSHYIGESLSDADLDLVGLPTAKDVSSFGDIRGLVPQGPAREGSYYAASVAHYGHVTDLNDATGDQKVSNYVIALSSPLPQVRIPVNGRYMTLVPFAKTVNSSGATDPTSLIGDFYVEEVGEDSGSFRIRFVAADSAADPVSGSAVVRYEYAVTDGDQIRIQLTSESAYGTAEQHIGYVVSGTTDNGDHLEEVRDIASDDDLPLATTHYFSLDESAGSVATLLKGPLWYAAKWGGFSDFNEDGVPGEEAEWTSASVEDPDPDNYYLVTNTQGIETQMASAFEDILEGTTSASSVAINSTVLEQESLIFQGRFDSEDWHGELLALSLDTSTGSLYEEVWDASEEIPAAAERNIVTWDSGQTTDLGESAPQGVDFDFTDTGLSDTYKSRLIFSGEDVATTGLDRLNYLRGDSADEQRNGGSFRDRPVSVLGDIVNSDPIYVQNVSYNFNILGDSTTEPEGVEALADPVDADTVIDHSGGTYRAFKTTQANRMPMVYVGGNDGMLHGFCVALCGTRSRGEEVMAYVPGAVSESLKELSAPAYSHQYYVDGSPHVLDAFISVNGADAAWKTVLLGTLGGGGKAVFALDITDPTNFSASSVLWEYPAAGYDSTDSKMQYLGEGISSPSIARLDAGDQWVALFGNGYNSDADQAALFIVDLTHGGADPSNVKVMPVGPIGEDNGLAAPTPVDTNNDGITDYVYAGDMLGNVWRFDLTDPDNPDNWIAHKIFTTQSVSYPSTDADGNAITVTQQQPITVRLAAGTYTAYGNNNNNTNSAAPGVLLLFGTGRYLSTGDKATTGMQSFYGVWDNLLVDAPTVMTIANLQEQTIVYENTVTGWRVVSDTAFEIQSSGNGALKGWYLDLVYPADSASDGERVINPATIRSGNVIFTTVIPSSEVCAAGGTSWLMEVDALSGGRLEDSVFDVNDDNLINEDDFILLSSDANSGASASGKYFGELIQEPAIISAGSVEYKYTSGSSGDVSVTKEAANAAATGRQSWRQIY